jgi:ketosteroid isomerase-like protein
VAEGGAEVVREQYEAVNRRDFRRAMELYADDVVLVVPPAEGVQDPGTYEGKKAVGDWFGNWFQAFADDYRFELEELEDLGGVIYLFATHGGSGRLSGVPVKGETAYLYHVRDGRITRVGFFADREAARQMATAPEWSGEETG